jgi:hypothetical protein
VHSPASGVSAPKTAAQKWAHSLLPRSRWSALAGSTPAVILPSGDVPLPRLLHANSATRGSEAMTMKPFLQLLMCSSFTKVAAHHAM